MPNCVMAGINRTVRSIKEFMLTGRFLSVEEGVYGMCLSDKRKQFERKKMKRD